MPKLVAGEFGSVLLHEADAYAAEGVKGPWSWRGAPVYAPDEVPPGFGVVELAGGEASTRARFPRAVCAAPVAFETSVPVIAVCSATTGSGKTALTRKVARSLRRSGVRVAVARHPLPDLIADPQVRLVADPSEISGGIQLREELAPVVGAGVPVAVGMDHRAVLDLAAANADLVVWDGGGSAVPWVRADLTLMAVDLLRELPAHAQDMAAAADAVVFTKADSADDVRAAVVESQIRTWNPDAAMIFADLVVAVPEGPKLRDSTVVIVEDAPSLVLGGLKAGAGAVAAKRFRCAVVDPRPFAVGAVESALRRHPHIGAVIPSVGATPQERADFAASVYATPGQAVLWGSPASPAGLVDTGRRPVLRVYSELAEVAGDSLAELLRRFHPGHS